MKRKRGIIWELEQSKFEEVVKNAKSYSDILRKLGLSVGYGNWKTLKARLLKDQIDHTHIPKTNKGRLFLKNSIPLSDLLTENSIHARGNIKRRLINEGLLEQKCSICEQLPVWRNKPMTLVIDHINGISNDNRIENLRLVCPNCNSQLETTNRNHVKKELRTFRKICNQTVIEGKNKEVCPSHFISKPRPRKVERPIKEALEKLIEKFPMTQLGKMFGVSDNAVKKWCKSYNISLPNRRGFWAKKRSLEKVLNV